VESKTAETGPDGVAEFAGLEPGRRYVWVTRTGGSRAHYAQVSGGRITEARIPLPAGSARLEVTVRDATKGPLQKVSLVLSREGEFRDSFHATTDEEGRGLFSELPAGDYSLRASGGAVGYSRHPSKSVSVPEGGRLSEEIVVGVVGLHGTVRDRSTGNPVPGVRVTIQDGAPYRSVSSDADGVYRFLDLPACTVSGVASKKGYGILFWKKVEVPEDGRKYDIDLDPAARLAIRITDPKGRPFVGRLYIGVHSKVPDVGTRVGTSVTADDTGLARYDEIVPGDYELTFRADGVGSAKVETKIATGDNSVDVRLE
jgi:hypothetical protein